MTPGTILWLGLLGLLAVAAALLLRRVAALARRTRDLDQFQRDVQVCASRLRAVTDPLARDLDALRRGAADPTVLRGSVSAARAELLALVEIARGLPGRPVLAALAAKLVAELERGVRALDLVEHGLKGLADVRSGSEAEGQTSLKRGSLNLRHATESCERVAREAASIRPADLADDSGGPPQSTAVTTATYVVDDGDEP